MSLLTQVKTMKTIKEYADYIGVSKDKVKYQLKKLPSEYQVKDENGIVRITERGIDELNFIFKKIPSATSELTDKPTLTDDNSLIYLAHIKSLEKTIRFYESQLEAKDKQIESQNEQISKDKALMLQKEGQLSSLIEQNNQLLLETKQTKKTKKKWKFWQP